MLPNNNPAGERQSQRERQRPPDDGQDDQEDDEKRRQRQEHRQPQRFPIADAHYAMGFAFLAEFYEQDTYNDQAVHFLEALEATRCRDYEDYCWGYPFDWETRGGTMKADTPLITTARTYTHVLADEREIDSEELLS